MAENEIRIKDLPSAQQINETDDVIVLDNATDGTRKLQGKVLLDMIHSAMAKGTASGAVATFTDGADNIPMTDLVISIEPQQSGSGDPSPENVRPISGWTACNVTRSGANILDESNLTSGYIDTDGTITNNASYSATDYLDFSNVNSIKYGVTKEDTGGWYYRIGCYNASKTFLGFAVNRTLSSGVYEGDADLLNNTNYIRVCWVNSSSNRYIYDNATYNTYTINFVDGSSPLTVYGAQLDVLNGLLTVNRGYDVFDGSSDEDWTLYNVAEGNLFRTTINNRKYGELNSDGKVISNEFTIVNMDNRGDGTISGGAKNVDVIKNSITSVSDFKTWLSSNNLQLCYELATPQTYQLTPTEVKSLLEVNNICADTGNIINAEYVRDTTTIINQILARLDALES